MRKEVNVMCSLKITLTLIIIFEMIYVKSYREKEHGLKYILLWSSLYDAPFMFWSDERKSLLVNHCKFDNCYIVKDREFFLDVTDYDAIMFNVVTLKYKYFQRDLPMARSDNQLYFFVALEPAAYCSLLEEKFNWFFNYTMTYRLDSDIIYSYFIVKDTRGKVVGPKINSRFMNPTRMKPTKASVIDKLKNKTLAGAWFVSNCYPMNNRLIYALGVNRALRKYNLNVDVFGLCGNVICPKNQSEYCLDLVEKQYFFYLAFENSNSEDYVTEKLTTALSHYAVPVTLGGANYSMFMPDGSYLNGNILTEEEVAEKMNEAIQDKQKYYDYFRWHRYYTYHPTEGGESDPLCILCAMLNDESIRNQRRVYAQFTKWWNEYRTQNQTDNIIEKYEDSTYSIKSVLTYRKKTAGPISVELPTTLEKKFNNFLHNLINYFSRIF